MDQGITQMMFALLRSAICGTKLTDEECRTYSREALPDLIKMAQRHDIAHLLAFGLKQNALLTEEDRGIAKRMLEAAYRYERLNYEYEQVCLALESAQVPFIPLKGSVLRKYYPQAWMRTSCDIDILVHVEDLNRAISYLSEHLQYVEKERTPHDVLLVTPRGNHVELHYDLVEEGRANNAIGVLSRVWEHVAVRENSGYWYEMSDSFFYFYHIAHMAKHFESGGCGIRPFIDLWLLDRIDGADRAERDKVLDEGGLLKFTNTARRLSNVWFGTETADELLVQTQNFILHGGVYGTTDNRVALQQKKKGGQFGYLLSRVFIPYAKLKRYYPVLEKHRWLTPIMQIRRWFMLLNPEVARMARKEISVNSSVQKSTTDAMNLFLDEIGL